MPQPLTPEELARLRQSIENDGVIPSLALRLIECAEVGIVGVGQPAPKADWEVALDDIDEALELADEMPERAAEEGFQPQDSLSGIRATIYRTHTVTSGQRTAINNMTQGIKSWLD